MSILSIDEIRKNPWNAVYGDLPEEADSLLLRVAYLAVDYCITSERFFADAAHAGFYMPALQEPDGLGALGLMFERHRKAQERQNLIAMIYEDRFGEML